ncbi:MAG: FAD-dependent oxidoreductase [Pseudomonadota bacterium]
MSGYATRAFWRHPDADTGHPSRGMPHGPFDVCVVGAGIAGLSTAYQLTRAGRRVLVVDDGPVASGQTARTTAHLASALDDRFSTLEKLRGSEIAKLAALSHAAAIDTIEATIAHEGLDCAFRRSDAYLLAHAPDTVAFLAEEEDAARRAGLAVERVDRAPLPGYDSGPCLCFHHQAQFDPMAYMDGLAQRISAAGATLLTGTRVAEVCEGTPAAVVTDDGVRFEAGAVVVATNAPINNRVTLPAREFPHITYVVALQPPPQLPEALFWDTEEPYHYVRIGEHDGVRALLVGGEDHYTGRANGDAGQRFARLEAWARERFPGAGPVLARWSGQVVETLDGLAYIGHSPGQRNVFVATGDSGMGMTHGTIAGLLLAKLIAGLSSPWSPAYDPARLPPRTLRLCTQENLTNTAAYGRWLQHGDAASEDAIAPGGGAVVRRGLALRAVYRDDDGALHVCSAVCPHLGGVVRWNPLERTWDCPVHGSRFACDGEALQGPANAGLRRM